MPLHVFPTPAGNGALTAVTLSDYFNTLTFFPVTGFFNAVADPSISGFINQPVVQPINALVTFRPRLANGQMIFISQYLVTAPYNAEQIIYLLGNPIGGTFTLEFLSDITGPLDWDSDPSLVQTALEALPSIGAGNVIVIVNPLTPQSYVVKFTSDLASVPIPAMVGDPDLLQTVQGVGFCAIEVAVTAVGSGQVIENTALAMPPLIGRIWNGVLSTIDRTDTPGFQLVANTSALNLDANNGASSSDGAGGLIYDVSFSAITFNDANQFLAPYAFVAPTDATPICISDPDLEVVPYQAPSSAPWTPKSTSPAPLALVGGDWRERHRRAS